MLAQKRPIVDQRSATGGDRVDRVAVGEADVACDMTWQQAGRRLDFTAGSDVGLAWLEAVRAWPSMRGKISATRE